MCAYAGSCEIQFLCKRYGVIVEQSRKEAAFSEKKLEVERLNKVIHNKNIALIVLGAVLLIIVTIAGTIMLIR